MNTGRIFWNNYLANTDNFELDGFNVPDDVAAHLRMVDWAEYSVAQGTSSSGLLNIDFTNITASTDFAVDSVCITLSADRSDGAVDADRELTIYVSFPTATVPETRKLVVPWAGGLRHFVINSATSERTTDAQTTAWDALTTYTVEPSDEIGIQINCVGLGYVRVHNVGAFASQDLPWGEFVGKTVNGLASNVSPSLSVSEGGLVMATGIKYRPQKGSIVQDFLTADFITGDWPYVAAHMARLPFYYQWSPKHWGLDCVMARAESVGAPTAKRGHMGVATGVYSLEIPIIFSESRDLLYPANARVPV